MTSEESLRIRSYLTAQGAKLSPEQLIGRVQEAMAKLREAANAVPQARFAEPPAPGEPRDVAARDTTPRALSQWWAMLERDRGVLFERVRSADPTARLDATIAHPFFGPLNWRETLLFIRLHDLDHAGQLAKVAGLA